MGNTKSILLKIKPCLIIVILSTVSIISYGQTEKIYETIYCENRSVIKGTILTEDQNWITIKLHNVNDTLVLDQKLITHTIDRKDNYLYTRGAYRKKHGFVNSISFQFGEDLYINGLTQLQFIRYKIISQKLGFGGGIGWSKTIDSQVVDYGQLFLYGKYFLTNGKRGFFVDSKLGAELKFTDSVQSEDYGIYSSGAQFQIGLGMEKARAQNGRISFHGNLVFRASNRFGLGYVGGLGYNF